jgi:hypothetical protein
MATYVLLHLWLMKNSTPFIVVNKAVKRFLAIIITVSAIITFQSSSLQAQVNIRLQPLWGPAEHDYVEYYYFPQQEVYYSVPKRQFVYLDGNSWRFANALPARYGTVDYYTTYKVVLNEPAAYKNHKTHKVKYVGYKNGHSKQVAIRDSRDQKYYIVKGHPNYNGKPKQSGNTIKSTPSSSGKARQAPAQKSHQPAQKGGSKGNSGNKGGKKH